MENKKTVNHNGFEILTEWHDGAEYIKNTNKARAAARRLLYKLEFLHGRRSYDVDDAFGLAYTSSSGFAAVWNTNAESRLAGTRLYFDGIAITEDGKTVGIFTERGEAGDEIGLKYMII